MMTNNKTLIKQLARVDVLKTEPIKEHFPKGEDDIIITDSDGVKQRVIIDNITNEELLLMIETKQLETLKYIKSVVRGYVIGCVIVLGIWLFDFLVELGSHM